MSLCLDHGHPEARLYPLGMLHDEAALIEERESARISTEASLRQSVIASLFGKKKSGFQKAVKQLSVTTKPRKGAFE